MGNFTRCSTTLFLGVLATLLTTGQARADWSTRETSTLRITPIPSPLRLPPGVPTTPESIQPKGFHLIVQTRPGAVIPVSDEYRVTVRYRGLDGKIYSVTRNLTPDKDGNARVFVHCDIDEPLTVMVETVTISPVQELAKARKIGTDIGCAEEFRLRTNKRGITRHGA